MSKIPVRPLCRGLSEPASESKQDEVTVTMMTDMQDTAEDGVSVVVTEEEESSPSPRSDRYTTWPFTHIKESLLQSLVIRKEASSQIQMQILG